jgi:hypothetical protein
MRTQGILPSFISCHKVRSEIVKALAASLDVIKKRLPAKLFSLMILRWFVLGQNFISALQNSKNEKNTSIISGLFALFAFEVLTASGRRKW